MKNTPEFVTQHKHILEEVKYAVALINEVSKINDSIKIRTILESVSNKLNNLKVLSEAVIEITNTTERRIVSFMNLIFYEDDIEDVSNITYKNHQFYFLVKLKSEYFIQSNFHPTLDRCIAELSRLGEQLSPELKQKLNRD